MRRAAGAASLVAAVHGGAGIAHAAYCVVTIRVDDVAPPASAPLSAIQFDVGYAQADGAFRGERTTTDCSFPLEREGAFASFNNKPDVRVLTGAAIALQSIQRPYDIAHCGFDYVTAPPTVDDFEVVVVEATSALFAPVVPTPDVVVSAIECPPDGVTTTTLPPLLCGQPVSQTGPPTAADALLILHAAIGLAQCNVFCQCDVDGSGVISAQDALHVLRASIGLSASLDCPAC